MKLTKLLLLAVALTAVVFSGCKSSDAKIKSNVEKALRSDETIMDPTVSVDDGIVTISGQCKDEACRTTCEHTARNVKGVKSVINNCTVPEPIPQPVPESVTTVLDEATQQKVRDGLKDIPGVTVTFTGDKAVLSGSVTPANRRKIMQMLASANVQSDVTNLKDK
jgi:hyperosmotically inducible periplasmic protein